MVLNRLNTDCGGRVALARSGAADQHDILSRFYKLAAVQLTYCRFIDLTGCKIEAVEIFVCREASDFGMVSDASHLAFCDLGLKQL